MRCPTLNELPPPPLGKIGWPWTEESSQLPGTKADCFSWSRISIVTPSFNQGLFIEETIRSVLLQGFPDLEYFIIDGGSADGSVEIIKKYQLWLTYWVSKPDRGQSHAINKGWEMATGEIFAYINSDDTYLPGALQAVASAFKASTIELGFVIGRTVVTDVTGNKMNVLVPRLPATGFMDLTLIDHKYWALPQQSSFWSRRVIENVGMMRESLHYTMDRELFYRVCKISQGCLMEEELATSRVHENAKSVALLIDLYKEDALALSMHDDLIPQNRLRRYLFAKAHLSYGYFRKAKMIFRDHKIRGLAYFVLALFLNPVRLFRKSTYGDLYRLFKSNLVKSRSHN